MARSSHGPAVLVDARLAPAGLTRLLGSYGAGRASVLAIAAALVLGACIVAYADPAPSVMLGLAFIVAVTLVSAEFGIRGGLRCAALAIAAMSAFAVLGWIGRGRRARSSGARRCCCSSRRSSAGPPSARPAAGACSSRCSRPPRTRSTSRTATGATSRQQRHRAADRPARARHRRPHERGAAARARHEHRRPRHRGARQPSPAAYEIAGRFGDRRHVLSVTKSPFRDATGHASDRWGSPATSPSSAGCRRRARASSTSRATSCHGRLRRPHPPRQRRVDQSTWAGAPRSCSARRSSTSCPPTITPRCRGDAGHARRRARDGA